MRKFLEFIEDLFVVILVVIVIKTINDQMEEPW